MAGIRDREDASIINLEGKLEDLNLEMDLLEGHSPNQQARKEALMNINDPDRIMERACKHLDKDIYNTRR